MSVKLAKSGFVSDATGQGRHLLQLVAVAHDLQVASLELGVELRYLHHEMVVLALGLLFPWNLT